MPRQIRDLATDRPAIDQLPSLALGLATYVWGTEFVTLLAEPTRIALYQAVAALAGLVLAAATFVCTLTYQSSSFIMSAVRRTHAGQIRRNWVAILRSLLLGSVLAVLAIMADRLSPLLAMSITMYTLTLVVARGVRAIWWLKFTLFVDYASDKSSEGIAFLPPTVPAPPSAS